MGELTAEELVDQLTGVIGQWDKAATEYQQVLEGIGPDVAIDGPYFDNLTAAEQDVINVLRRERGRVLFLVWDDPDNPPFDPPVLIFARVLPDDDEPNEEANNAR